MLKKKKTPKFRKTNKKRWLRTESNRRHMDFQSIALPTELLSLESVLNKTNLLCHLKNMAVRAGLQPAASCVTGRDSYQTNYPTKIRGQGLKHGTPGYEPD